MTSPITTPIPFNIDYGSVLEAEIEHIQGLIGHTAAVRSQFPDRWLAIQLLEGDVHTRMQVQVLQGGSALLEAADQSIQKLEKEFNGSVDIVTADHRYTWINAAVNAVVLHTKDDEITTSDRIDRIVTHPWLGIPIFLAAMWVVFKLTTDVSAPFLDWISMVISGPVTRWISAILGWVHLSGTWAESLFVDGIIAGVGGLLVFVPVLMFLFFTLAVLEDSGYMGRAAFVMDRLMNLIGLQGKSFLPMLVGFGCTVPAMYATRTLENENDRVLTGLLVPFMSCGARLPVYILIAAVFFPRYASAVVFSMYLLGILVAVLIGLILKKTLFKNAELSAFVMELPPYQIPTLRGVWSYMWTRTSAFLKNAWTVIMLVSIVLWLFMAIPTGGSGRFGQTEADKNLFVSLSSFVTPVLEPLGFGSWEAGSALISGFVAKEVVVSTMSQVYNLDGPVESAKSTSFFTDLVEIGSGFIQATWDTMKSLLLIVGVNLFAEDPDVDQTALMRAVRKSFDQSSGGAPRSAGLAFMVFVLLYTPCVAALAAERKELGGKWMWVSIFGQLAIAWLAAFCVFHCGVLVGLG